MAVGGVMFVPAYDWPPALATGLDYLVRFLVVATLVATLGSGFSYVKKTMRILSEENA